jgi:hypothetical protein
MVYFVEADKNGIKIIDRFLKKDKKSRTVSVSRTFTGGPNPTPERGA